MLVLQVYVPIRERRNSISLGSTSERLNLDPVAVVR